MKAILSDCGNYRFRLERDGPGDGATAIIMINPAKADAYIDDATIRKVKGFGERHHWGRIIVGNLFAYRAVDVNDLRDPCHDLAKSSENLQHLEAMMQEADQIIFAWGSIGKLPAHLRGQWEDVWFLARVLGKTPMCLGTCNDGHPRHPLMAPYDCYLGPWGPPDSAAYVATPNDPA